MTHKNPLINLHYLCTLAYSNLNKWAIPGLFFIHFWLFSNKHYIFYNNNK